MGTTRALIVLLAVAPTFALTAGCQRGDEKPGAATTTAARRVSNDAAVMRLTITRCDRELECNNVGTGRKFVDHDACTRELGQDAQATVRAEDCPGGVDEGKLSTCLADIRGERCEDPLGTIDRLMSCRRAQLCLER